MVHIHKFVLVALFPRFKRQLQTLHVTATCEIPNELWISSYSNLRVFDFLKLVQPLFMPTAM
ncbi:hypothetical protein BY458DRAFT_496040 [Sporodiniella umbellata]|nr:hypothetical protein BY458DRAFT_496040 [Sporodiniella umbellata]